MEKALTCDCGYEAHARDEDALAAKVQRHAWNTHGMALSREEALVVVFRGELNRLPTTPRKRQARTEEEK